MNDVRKRQGREVMSRKSKKCCKYHNKMVFIETDLQDCGHSGMGRPIVCCQDCPDNSYPVDMPLYYKTNIDLAADRSEWQDLYG